MYTYDELKQFVDHCTRCPLSQTRNKAVMGKGSLHSPILLLLRGRGGMRIRTAFLLRESPAYCWISFCQESTCPEMRFTLPILLLRPKIIVCLGRIAAQRIIRPDYRITREHGTFVYRKNVWLTAVYHPSAVLRDETKLPEIISDFQAIKEKMDDIARSG